MYSFRTPQKKSYYYRVHTNPHPSIYNLVLAAPIRRGKMPSEPHQGTQGCIPKVIIELKVII
jgi:hypothetical protein